MTDKTFQTSFLIILLVSHPTAFKVVLIPLKLIEAKRFFSPEFGVWYDSSVTRYYDNISYARFLYM